MTEKSLKSLRIFDDSINFYGEKIWCVNHGENNWKSGENSESIQSNDPSMMVEVNKDNIFSTEVYECVPRTCDTCGCGPLVRVLNWVF